MVHTAVFGLMNDLASVITTDSVCSFFSIGMENHQRFRNETLAILEYYLRLVAPEMLIILIEGIKRESL